MSEAARVYPLNRPSRMTLRAGATLIVDGEYRILVDTGHFSSPEELGKAVWKAAGLGLEEITDSFFTHLHFDHYRPLFPAGDLRRVHFPRVEVAYLRELMRHREEPGRYREFLLDTHDLIAPVFLREFLRLAEDPRYRFETLGPGVCLRGAGERIAPHVETVAMAGHCPGQLGLRVETTQGVCLIAGDAVLSLGDFLAPDVSHHLIVYNRERLLLSRQRVAEADFVVPGHGSWFDPKRGASLESSGEHS